MKTFLALMRYIVKNTTSCKTPLTDLMGIPGILVSASKQISHSKSLKSYRLSWTNPIPHCNAVKLEKKFYLACGPIKKKKEREREKKPSQPPRSVGESLIFRRSLYCVVSCANVQKAEPHQRAGTAPWAFSCVEGKKKRGKTNLEVGRGGRDGGIYRVVWESLQWQEPNEEQFRLLIHSAVSPPGPCVTVSAFQLWKRRHTEPTQRHGDRRWAGVGHHLKKKEGLESTPDGVGVQSKGATSWKSACKFEVPAVPAGHVPPFWRRTRSQVPYQRDTSAASNSDATPQRRPKTARSHRELETKTFFGVFF